MDYHSKIDDRNHGLEEEDEVPHPDLKKALVALHPDFAKAHYVLGEERENFIPNGFSITKAGNEDAIDQVNITGKLVTSYKNKISITSGDIPMTSKGLEEKINTLRVELWAFFFNSKTAVTQTEIPGFPAKGDVPEEGDTGDPPVDE